MPSTITTVESFPGETDEAYIKKERDLRIAAGAITSEISGGGAEPWVITTVWNVIGQG